MRRGALELLAGGGQPSEAECQLCADAYVVEGVEQRHLVAEMEARGASGRLTLCEGHRADLEARGFRFGPVVREARKQRRATKAAMKRAHRASLPKRPMPNPQRTAVPPDTYAALAEAFGTKRGNGGGFTV